MKIKPYVRWWGPDGDVTRAERGYTFWCPGCKSHHHFRTSVGVAIPPPPPRFEQQPDGKIKETPGRRALWTFDGNQEAPSFSPSLLYRHYAGKWIDEKWVESGEGKVDCHLVLTAGKIGYLNDCPHEFSGKTVEMEELNP